MSWNGYIDNLKGSGHVDKAAIISVTDGSVWAASPDFNVAPGEAKAVLAGFANSDPLRTTGVIINGTKYFFLQSDEAQIQGKKGPCGVSIAKSRTCALIATYTDGMQPGACRNSVENLRDYLLGNNY